MSGRASYASAGAGTTTPRGFASAPRWVAGLIAVVGVLLTAVATWSAARVDRASEERLLDQQTRQAATVLSSAIMVIQAPMATALTVQSVAGPGGDAEAFPRSMSSYVGSNQLFVSASLWRRTGDRLAPVATVGIDPALAPGSREAQDQVRAAFRSSTAVVRKVTAGGQARIVWVQADPRTGYAVYAERAIPADRRSPVDRDSAFANLDYAIYLGPRATPEALSTTDVDPASLPLEGTTARESVDFGDTVLTLVTSPREHLGSALSRWLPLGLLVGGLLLTGVATVAGHRLARGRSAAEDDAATITGLYEQVDSLYGEQRDLFERLQRALLPQAHPTLPNLEIAARYVAGARGTEIGGDWYSVVALDEHRFGFVVGDVSGRGVDTVAVMAQARFTIRAYLLDGDEPAVALEKCSHQFDIATDGHLTTVISGIGDVRTGKVTLANAGHPPPVLVGDEVTLVEVPPGRPLGTGPGHYDQTTIELEPGATLFCFTDGLVERRGESIDVGLERLAGTLAGGAGLPVDDLVTHAVATLRNADAADDVAALAIRLVEAR